MRIHYTKHALKRRKERGILHNAIVEVLQTGSSKYLDGAIWSFKKRNIVVIIDVFHMVIITCVVAENYKKYNRK